MTIADDLHALADLMARLASSLAVSFDHLQYRLSASVHMIQAFPYAPIIYRSASRIEIHLHIIAQAEVDKLVPARMFRSSKAHDGPIFGHIKCSRLLSITTSPSRLRPMDLIDYPVHAVRQNVILQVSRVPSHWIGK